MSQFDLPLTPPKKKKTIKAPQNAPKEKLAWKVDNPPSTPNTT
jgi:hypothetical protein